MVLLRRQKKCRKLFLWCLLLWNDFLVVFLAKHVTCTGCASLSHDLPVQMITPKDTKWVKNGRFSQVLYLSFSLPKGKHADSTTVKTFPVRKLAVIGFFRIIWKAIYFSTSILKSKNGKCHDLWWLSMQKVFDLIYHLLDVSMPGTSSEQKYLPMWSCQSYLLNMLALIFIASHIPSIKSNLTKLILLSIYMWGVLFLAFITGSGFLASFTKAYFQDEYMYLDVGGVSTRPKFLLEMGIDICTRMQWDYSRQLFCHNTPQWQKQIFKYKITNEKNWFEMIESIPGLWVFSQNGYHCDNKAFCV